MATNDSAKGGDGASRTLRMLRGTAGVTPMTLPQGQILIYKGHFPIGVFVIYKGAVELNSDGDAGGQPARIVDAKIGLFLYPEYPHLNHRSSETAVIKRKVELLFVPRSLIFTNLQVREALESL